LWELSISWEAFQFFVIRFISIIEWFTKCKINGFRFLFCISLRVFIARLMRSPGTLSHRSIKQLSKKRSNWQVPSPMRSPFHLELMWLKTRLLALLADRYEHCLLIPRSAVLQRVLGFVLRNLIWNGISFKECGKPTSYQHWRIPHHQQTLLEKSLSNPAFGFIESITLQEPWINKLSFDPTGIILKNLR
jgi:hypothetical protein